MIEQTVKDYLGNLLSVPVHTEVPINPPSSFVVIEKTGGSSVNHISTNTLAIQSYAESMYLASLLNEEVKDAMENIITLNSISRCSLEGDYNYTDTRTKQYRYQAVFSLVHFE